MARREQAPALPRAGGGRRRGRAPPLHRWGDPQMWRRPAGAHWRGRGPPRPPPAGRRPPAPGRGAGGGPRAVGGAAEWRAPCTAGACEGGRAAGRTGPTPWGACVGARPRGSARPGSAVELRLKGQSRPAPAGPERRPALGSCVLGRCRAPRIARARRAGAGVLAKRGWRGVCLCGSQGGVGWGVCRAHALSLSVRRRVHADV
jgi:hypothetical protein